MLYTTEDFPIKLEYWYIVSMNNFLNITVYPVYFINKVSAKRAINRTFKTVEKAKYVILSGKKLRQYKMKYAINLGKLARFTKYDFPPNATRQQKKTRRTVIRRRLRRMGMLIPKKHKIGIKEKVGHARLLENTQVVAQRATKNAQAFRLERKPKHNYYIILNKIRSNKNKVMFEAKCIRYNSKNGKYKKLLMHIYNRDVIIPHLITEVYAQSLNKGNYEQFKKYCRSKGIGIFKGQEN